MPTPSLPELEVRLIEILRGQGLPVEEIRLIGLLGQGNRASVFSVLVDNVYHVLKVYDSSDSLRAELKHLRRIMPKDRFLFWWQEKNPGENLNLSIVEVPEGRELNSTLLNQATASQLAERLIELHRISYRQKISLSGLLLQLDRHTDPFLAHIEQIGRSPEQYRQIVLELRHFLQSKPALFRGRKVRIHGDLWWPNIICAAENVYLIDWESVHRGDAAEDIAKLRVFLYDWRSPVTPIYFWQSLEDHHKVTMMIKAIVDRHNQSVGNQDLTERLKFYMPLMAMNELASRYLGGAVDKAFVRLVADDFLNLYKDPFASPPDLTEYGYWGEIEASRQTNLELPTP